MDVLLFNSLFLSSFIIGLYYGLYYIIGLYTHILQLLYHSIIYYYGFILVVLVLWVYMV